MPEGNEEREKILKLVQQKHPSNEIVTVLRRTLNRKQSSSPKENSPFPWLNLPHQHNCNTLISAPQLSRPSFFCGKTLVVENFLLQTNSWNSFRSFDSETALPAQKCEARAKIDSLKLEIQSTALTPEESSRCIDFFQLAINPFKKLLSSFSKCALLRIWSRPKFLHK